MFYNKLAVDMLLNIPDTVIDEYIERTHAEDFIMTTDYDRVIQWFLLVCSLCLDYLQEEQVEPHDALYLAIADKLARMAELFRFYEGYKLGTDPLSAEEVAELMAEGHMPFDIHAEYGGEIGEFSTTGKNRFDDLMWLVHSIMHDYEPVSVDSVEQRNMDGYDNLLLSAALTIKRIQYFGSVDARGKFFGGKEWKRDYPKVREEQLRRKAQGNGPKPAPILNNIGKGDILIDLE